MSFPLDVQCLVHLVQISCWTLAATTHVELVRQQTLFHFNFNIIIYFVFLTGNLRTWHLGSHSRLADYSAIVKFGDFDCFFTGFAHPSVSTGTFGHRVFWRFNSSKSGVLGACFSVSVDITTVSWFHYAFLWFFSFWEALLLLHQLLAPPGRLLLRVAPAFDISVCFFATWWFFRKCTWALFRTTGFYYSQ